MAEVEETFAHINELIENMGPSKYLDPEQAQSYITDTPGDEATYLEERRRSFPGAEAPGAELSRQLAEANRELEEYKRIAAEEHNWLDHPADFKEDMPDEGEYETLLQVAARHADRSDKLLFKLQHMEKMLQMFEQLPSRF